MSRYSESSKFVDALRDCLDLPPLYRAKRPRPDVERFCVYHSEERVDGRTPKRGAPA